MKRPLLIGCIANLLFLPLALSVADDGDSKKTPVSSRGGSQKPTSKGKSFKGKLPPGITPEREAAVMTFVQRHHRELGELLMHLKENLPKEYERAVRDLFRTSERLAQLHERDYGRYELELERWKVQSRVQLLTARYGMTPDPALRKQLAESLNTQLDVRKKVLERERDKLAERLDKLERQLEQIMENRQATVERQLRVLIEDSRTKPVKDKKNAGPTKDSTKP